ncbi:hypothetical protein Tco_1426398 [Tanacetum coccineum]
MWNPSVGICNLLENLDLVRIWDITQVSPLSGCDRLVIRAKFGALVMPVIEMCELGNDADINTVANIMPPRMRTRSAGQHVAKSRGGGTGEQVGRGGRGRGPRGGNNERVNELNGQENNQEEGANRNVEGVNGGTEGASDFSTIIAQQLQNLLPAILAQVGNQ